jgi:hypothetical protein
MASELEYVSSDWVAVELRAVAVVLSECACGRESSVPSLGCELIRRARLHDVEGGGRGDQRGCHTRPLGKEDLQAVGGLSPKFVIARTASGSSCLAPWPAATEALLSS